MSLSWSLTFLGLILSVLGTVIILRWPTYVTPIVQDKNKKKWVRVFTFTSGAGEPHWSMGNSNNPERSDSPYSGFSAPSRGIRPNGSVLVNDSQAPQVMGFG